MFFKYSCLRPGHGKFYYRWHPPLYYPRSFCSVARAVNEKCAVKKLNGLRRSCIFPKTFFSCLPSGKETLKIFKKNNVQIARLLKSRTFSQGNKEKKPSGFPLVITLVIIAFMTLIGLAKSMYTILDWEEFVHDFLMRGEVEKIICKSKSVVQIIVRKDAQLPKEKYQSVNGFLLNISDFKTFEEDLREIEDKLGIAAGDRIPVIPYHEDGISILNILVFVALSYFLLKGSQHFSKMNPFPKMRKAKFTLIDPFTGGTKEVKFSDVAGLKEAKQEIMEFVDYLKRPERYKELGAKVPKGALLLGPPGCGKTMLAKAVASEANVPFLSMNGSEFIELIGGLGAARVRDLFSEARNISPCIIYIDEIDAIGRKRADSGLHDTSLSEAEHTLNQLLVEMDGMASREGVITLASTNRADVLDKALLRPGRFDRHIMIDFPSAEERREIFVQYLKRIRLENAPEHYAKRMASLTPGFTGADIANICNEAALHAARFKKKIITGDDLEYAIDRVVGGTEKRSSAISPEEKLLVAYHEAGCVLVGWLSERGEILVKISVVPRTHQSVGWTQFLQPEQYLFSQEELFDKMCMALGGRAAELLIFNKISTKSEKDLKKITKLAYSQVRQYGMNDVIGPLSFGETKGFQRKPYSKQLAAVIDEEAKKLVAKAFQQADHILRSNKNLLVKLAQELLKRESMTFSDVEALIGPPKNAKKKMIEPLVFELSIDMAAKAEADLPKPD